MLIYLYLLCQDKKLKQTNTSFFSKYTYSEYSPVKTRRPDLGRLLNLQGECCLMLKMNTGHSLLTASGARLLI